MRLCIVEDNAVSDLEPLVLTRPCFELRLGFGTIASKIELAVAPAGDPIFRGAMVRPYLAAILKQRQPDFHVNDSEWLKAGPTFVANGRWVPPVDFRFNHRVDPCIGTCEGRPAFGWVDAEQAAGLDLCGPDSWFEELSGEVPSHEVGGEWVERPWDLVSMNGKHLARDFVEHHSSISRNPNESITVVGPRELLSVHPSARIDPYTVFDTTSGPIVIDAGVIVQPFTRVEGPAYIGKDTQLFRANIRGGVTIGPNCRIGGEVEASIVHGHSNKYHEGFLGHAYVGEWVNLGAITSNSDLRNDYGDVAVPLQGDPINTGQAKVGCFIGDHTRTGLGTMLNTGTAIGVMCNVLPAGPLAPKYVPSFTAVSFGRVEPGFSLDRMFETARVVMSRRAKEFSDVEQQLYLDLFEKTRPERERAFRKSQQRRGEAWAVAAPSLRINAAL